MHGGREATGIDAVAWAREAARRGAGEILLTSMDRDGSREGFDCALTRAVARAVDIPVIASGGVGKLEHFAQGILEGEADAVLAASVFHFGELSVRQVKEHMRAQRHSRQAVGGLVVDLSKLAYNDQGLIPCIVQDADTLEVLMMAWMSERSLALTLERGETVFWSRSRQELWHKGATSGNVQKIVELRYDCDADALLALVHPAGPACHTGARSCFYRALAPEA